LILQSFGDPFTFNRERKVMDEDNLIAIVVVGLVATCAITSIIGAFVCPLVRPRRMSGYLEDDLV
jgi:hypothetical protein